MYQFQDDKGTFKVKNPDRSSHMYFPLCNEAGLKGAISPELGGDLKVNQNTFALQPTSIEELQNARATRNFWVKVNDETLWSVTGQSAAQHALKYTSNEEETELEAGFLYHTVTRSSKVLNLQSTVTSFVPSSEDKIELTKFEVTNTGNEVITLEATSAIPLYGRSADNYRDHRHVTSLLNRAQTSEHGLWMKPTLSFDERGHLTNEMVYGVIGQGFADGHSSVDIVGYIPTVEEMTGEGSGLDWPVSLFDRDNAMSPIGTKIDGYETLAGICFEKLSLKPGETVSFILGIYIVESSVGSINDYNKAAIEAYCQPVTFDEWLGKTQISWQEKVDVIKQETSNHAFDQWMRWINIQPILRRIYGCSFLPHHDYGRGGRGWRDLWQDCLALLLMEPKDVRFLLLNNFAGVRIDGTNATIIGDQPGEFVADRNNISRTWMDHGAWPWLTTKEYIHQSGDIDFLFEEQTYFKDALMNRSAKVDEKWNDTYGNFLKTESGDVYKGTLLEHLLIQNMSIFYNVGEHNILKLEDADWNDALDMAHHKGESVPFTALYTSNLRDLSQMLKDIKVKQGLDTIKVTDALLILMEDVDLTSIEAKHKKLDTFFDAVDHVVSGVKVDVEIDDLCKNLDDKVAWMTDHLRQQEFITNQEGYKWFNSYYDDHGNAVEGDHENGTRMMLTGQVFTLMGHIASDEEAAEVVRTSKHYLQDLKVGGYRLNTDFKEVKSDLGRAFGFAYGHKENGAMFSHMAIMYGNALYRRGFVKEGYELISDLFNHCSNFDVSRIYPSVPEYVSERGRGMYTYLTGSASWLIYTVVTEMFGCNGHYGDLRLAPKLLQEQFKEGSIQMTFLYNGSPLTVNYILAEDSGQSNDYQVGKVSSDSTQIEFTTTEQGIVVSKSDVERVQQETAILDVVLRYDV